MSLRAEVIELTAIIADDEALARRRVADLLRGRDGVRVLAQCENGAAALAAVREERPHVLFLDVQMPGMSGFDVLAALDPEERPLVIFCTAYDEYALAAFEVHAVDYLLKPYADERFHEALRRAEETLRSARADELQERLRGLLREMGPATEHGDDAPGASGAPLERFAVRSGGRVVIVDAGSVERIEADGDYVKLHAGGKRHLLRATMASLETRLDSRRFLRIHRSAIVPIDRIRYLDHGPRGELLVVLSGDVRLRVGRSYRDAVLERVGARW